MKQLIAIVGPTATGKSVLALQLAQGIRGAAIISADSRQVYRGLDIGTAKPTPAERALVPHHLIDVVDPDQPFSLAEYQRLAYAAIDATECPFLVGGTGLYFQAVVDGFVLPAAPPNTQLRADNLAIDELLALLHALDPVAAEQIDTANRYRILRAVERAGSGPLKAEPRYEVALVGLTAPRQELYRRSDERVDRMLERGWLEEVRELRLRFPPNLPALSGLGYRELADHLAGALSLEDPVRLVKQRTRQFIKRQLTWFKRDQRIQWFDITMTDWTARVTDLVGNVWKRTRA